MIVRRWKKVDGNVLISCVAPYTEVAPELLLEADDTAPHLVEVRRTYETVFRRFIQALTGSLTKKVVELVKVDEGFGVATYESWQAAHYEPLLKPTKLYYQDVPGAKENRSTSLSVTPTVDIINRRPSPSLKLADPTGSIPLGVEIPLWSEQTMKTIVQAPADPEIELFVLSPQEHSEGLSLDAYVQGHLSIVEQDLEEASASRHLTKIFRPLFEREYEAYVEGAGRIDVEIESPRRIVAPGEPEVFDIALQPVTAGETMVAIGARSVDTGEILSMSELLPLRWDPGDTPVHGTTETEREWTIARETEKVRVKAAPTSAPREREVAG